MAGMTMKVDVSKKGVTVSSHEGSDRFGSLNDAALFMACFAREGCGEDSVLAKIRVWDTYPKADALRAWLHANGITRNERYDVDIRWMVL